MKRRMVRRRRRNRGVPNWIWAGAVGLVVAVLVTVGVASHAGSRAATTATEVSVVVPAGSTDQTDMTIVGRPATLLQEAAERNGLVEQIKVDGDGEVMRQVIDMTPRQTNGPELKVAARRVQAITRHLAEMEAEYNAFDASAPGRSVLAGLQAVEEGGHGPVLVFAPLPDTNDPLDFEAMAFDSDVRAVVARIKATGDIPHHLAGREVIFVVTPVAGKQQPFRQPQADYIRDVFTALVEEAGGSATFITGAGGQPRGTAGEVPTITVPDPAGTLRPPEKQRESNSSGTTEVATCTLPAPMLFSPDQAILLDPSEARRALRTCLKDTNPTTRIAVDGHTARTGPGGDPDVAEKLSTDRAQAVADLLEELGVDAHQITRIKGWGSTKPIVKPVSDAGNRAVVVSMRTTYTKGLNR